MTVSAAVPDATLQINLCAGDLAYADALVGALVATHRADVREVVVVADACRPPSTPWLHAGERFPPAEFATRVARLRERCTALQAAGLVDRVVWLEPDRAALRALNRRFSGVGTTRSHDHLGHAFSAYFLGWDSARTRYVAHFDADILLWQQPGFSWIRRALAGLEADSALLAVSPRISPPGPDGALVDLRDPASGWSATWPLERTAAGWRSPWFSTRCHLVDRERLARVLPLGGSVRAAAVTALLTPLFDLRSVSGANRSALARRLAHRLPPFPLPPEVLLHEHAQRRGFSCLYLDDPRAWFIHPDTKPERFLRLLPGLLAAVVQRGEAPEAQRGRCGVRFEAWENHLSAAR